MMAYSNMIDNELYKEEKKRNTMMLKVLVNGCRAWRNHKKF